MNENYYIITNKKSKKAIDVYGACFKSGSYAICHSLNEGNNQVFYIKNMGNDVFTMMACHSNKYLGFLSKDDVLTQSEYKNQSNQKFTFIDCGLNCYRIKVNSSNLFLTTDDSDKIFQDNFKEIDFQIWEIKETFKKTFNPIVIASGNYYITNVNSNKVLDVYGYNYGISHIKQNSLNNGNNQIFYVESLEDGTFRMMALHSGMYAEVYSSSKDDYAVIKENLWNGGDNQRFYFEQYTLEVYMIRSKLSSKVLTIENSSLSDGGNVIQLAENGSNSQLFTLQFAKKNINNHPNCPLIPEGYYKIQNTATRKLLDVYGFSMDDKAQVLQYADNGGNNQIFYFKYLNFDSYNIIAAHSNKAIEVKDSSLNDGAILSQMSLINNADNQIFYVEPYGENFVLRVKHSNKVISIKDTGFSEGEKVIQLEQNGTFAQIFNLIKASKSKYNFPSGIAPAKMILDVPIIPQRPELPTGCEITCITMMLRYCGANVTKVNLAYEMPKAVSDPNLGFVGSPFTNSGWTIYPPALMNLVKKYAGNSINLTGCSLDKLEEQIMNNKLVVVWVSYMYNFTVHAMTMVGYDSSYYYFNDPWGTIKNLSLNKADFNQKWSAQSKRAISY